MNAKDMRGTEIFPGARVVWAVIGGRYDKRAYLRIGTVVKVVDEGIDNVTLTIKRDDTKKCTWTKALHKLIVFI